MRLDIVDGMGRVYQIHASRVVVSGDAGTPFAAIYQHAPTAYTVVRLQDPEFERTLSVLGHDRTVVVSTQRLVPAADIDFGGR